MAGQYSITILGRDGVKRAEVSDMIDLAYTRRVNAPGLLTFTLPPEHPAIALLELDGQVEVYRRDVADGIAWTRDFGTLYRGMRYVVDSDGNERFEASCVGQLHWLSRRIVAYPADLAGLSKVTSAPAETIMRLIVEMNCTTQATVANRRLRAGAIAGITTAATQGRGSIVSWSGPWKNVLTELQGLAAPTVGNGDFDLVKVGAQAWEFRFYPGQLGTDRSTAGGVLFSRTFDNMGEPTEGRDRIDEKTVAIVGGQGEEVARLTTVRLGADAAETDIELFVDARQGKSLSALAKEGDAALYEAQARPTLTFTPLQTPQTLYGKHYFLGDLVRASYRGLTEVRKVNAATITLTSDGDEQIAIETAAI